MYWKSLLVSICFDIRPIVCHFWFRYWLRAYNPGFGLRLIYILSTDEILSIHLKIPELLAYLVFSSINRYPFHVIAHYSSEHMHTIQRCQLHTRYTLKACPPLQTDKKDLSQKFQQTASYLQGIKYKSKIIECIIFWTNSVKYPSTNIMYAS